MYRCKKIRIFVLRKFVKRTEKIVFSLVFVSFRFTEISYFLNFPPNENVRKQHLSANAFSCVNMNFSHTIAARKDEIFYLVLLRKQVIQVSTCVQINFSLKLFKRKDEICYVILQLKQDIGQLFVEDVCIFQLIFCWKSDQRVDDVFLSPSWQ